MARRTKLKMRGRAKNKKRPRDWHRKSLKPLWKIAQELNCKCV